MLTFGTLRHNIIQSNSLLIENKTSKRISEDNMMVTEMFFRNELRSLKQNIYVQSKAKVYAQTHLNTFSIRQGIWMIY